MDETAEKRGMNYRRYFVLFACLGALSVLALWLLWQAHPDREYWISLLKEGHLYLESRPWALLLALLVLPGIGFPVSPLLILVGLVLGPRYGMPAACALGVLALGLCTSWTYWAAAGPFRGILERHVLKDRRLPSLATGNAMRIGLILRITPGIPYALQNVALGLIGLPFKTYLLVSIPIQSIYAIGFIITGGAIFEGRAGLAITGGVLLVAIILITRLIRSRRNAQPR